MFSIFDGEVHRGDYHFISDVSTQDIRTVGRIGLWCQRQPVHGLSAIVGHTVGVWALVRNRKITQPLRLTRSMVEREPFS